MSRVRVGLLFVFTLSCGGTASVIEPEATGSRTRGHGGKADGTEIASNFARRIARIGLQLDYAALSGLATIWLEPSTGTTASFEAKGLRVDDVFTEAGPIEWELREGNLHVVHSDAAVAIQIAYHFAVQTSSTGLGPAGSTVIWPTYCGNLFPCHSDPGDGVIFDVAVSGLPEGATAIYPEHITTETPAYTFAFAVGQYTCQVLGKTTAGTEVSVCWLPKGKTRALTGTKRLTAVFDWLESHIGPYAFGDAVASVSANWGEAAAGGMEHHPFWHVATGEMDLPITHAHEAAHGWFGAGVRIACWEDLVLSEGTVSYLAARALGAADGPDTEAALWVEYEAELRTSLVDDGDYVILPDTCGEVDLFEDVLWSNVLYMKGAFFFRAVAELVGADLLDGALAAFYQSRVGQAARMTDLLDAIELHSGVDVTPLADLWLHGLGNPLDG